VKSAESTPAAFRSPPKPDTDSAIKARRLAHRGCRCLPLPPGRSRRAVLLRATAAACMAGTERGFPPSAAATRTGAMAEQARPQGAEQHMGIASAVRNRGAALGGLVYLRHLQKLMRTILVAPHRTEIGPLRQFYIGVTNLTQGKSRLGKFSSSGGDAFTEQAWKQKTRPGKLKNE
jgi:hypothetical protein